MKNAKSSFTIGTFLLTMGLMPCANAADSAPLSYIAAPDTYQLLGENDQFRVIMQTSKPGQRDAWHSHSAQAAYRLTDCKYRIYQPDGKYNEVSAKAGRVGFLPDVKSHSFENVGTTDCKALLIERK